MNIFHLKNRKAQLARAKVKNFRRDYRGNVDSMNGIVANGSPQHSRRNDELCASQIHAELSLKSHTKMLELSKR